jgi:enamine deaminase RidA (YjgF/YER057c/UK114 family)
LKEELSEMNYLRGFGFVVFSLILSMPLLSQSNGPQAEPVKFINPSELSVPSGYSRAAVVSGGKIIFVAGIAALNKQGQMLGAGDFRTQATEAFANLRKALAAVGAKPNQVIKLNYFVVGLNKEKQQILREIRDGFVDKANPPTSTLVGVQALFREDCLLEVEATAVIP